jgi:methylated-DNA-protein-cysteine methyltransferase related protein
MKENGRAPLTERILQVIKAIPKGKVAAYGQIAALAGIPKGARQVSRILHSLSERENLPWHRVISRNGCISLPMDGGGALQRRLLLKERVDADVNGRIDVERHGWKPKGGKSGFR